jgi:hypothetical protein
VLTNICVQNRGKQSGFHSLQSPTTQLRVVDVRNRYNQKYIVSPQSTMHQFLVHGSSVVGHSKIRGFTENVSSDFSKRKHDKNQSERRVTPKIDLVNLRSHQRKGLRLSYRSISQKAKKSLRNPKSARWWHAIFKSLYELFIIHLGFFIPCITKL